MAVIRTLSLAAEQRGSGGIVMNVGQVQIRQHSVSSQPLDHLALAKAPKI